MITVVTSTREPKEEFKEHLIKTCGLGEKHIEILQYKNNGEYSLSEIYNKGLKEAKNDIIVFCHDDISFARNSWGNRLEKNFKRNPEYGILGVAGSIEMNDSGTWWNKRYKMIGRVMHRDIAQNKTWESNYSKDIGNNVRQVVALDGVFFAIDRKKIKCDFDESYKGFHFYDVSFTFANHLKGCKVGVITNIKIIHNSVGQTNEKWEENKTQFIAQYKEFLPEILDVEVQYDDISIQIENEPKLAIIIPTKDKYELISCCLKSIIDKTDYQNYKIYIADTGSCDFVKKKLKEEFLDVYDNIVMIEYDYYNYAKINNDMVRNYIDKDSELILLCNNDIELLNDSISIMVKTYIDNKETVGTIGCRLHYGNGTIQHLGILAFKRKDDTINLTHNALDHEFEEIKDKTPAIIKLYGNTAAFLLISKEQFIKYGMLNEHYEICFEDVELNFQALLDKKTNYCCTNAVNYHYESQTRGKKISINDYEKIMKFSKDRGIFKLLHPYQ